MNKSELVKQIADRAGLSQAKAGDALDAFCASVIDALAQGGEVAIIGFGTFKTSDRAERMGRNPQTGEAVLIPASRVPKFSAGKALKDAVKQTIGSLKRISAFQAAFLGASYEPIIEQKSQLNPPNPHRQAASGHERRRLPHHAGYRVARQNQQQGFNGRAARNGAAPHESAGL